MDRWGRRFAMRTFAVISIVAGGILAASQNAAMFTVFRFFTGLGSWAFLNISKLFDTLTVSLD